MQHLQADLENALANIQWSVGLLPAGVILITWEGQSWYSSTFLVLLVFSQDWLFPSRPGTTGIIEPDNVLSANSSFSINILSIGVVLLFFIDCTNYIHVLMGFWRALFMQSWTWSHSPLVLCCVFIQDLKMLFRKKKLAKWVQISLIQWSWFVSLGCKCLLPATGCWDEGESFNSITEHHRAAECAGKMLGRWVWNICTFWACTSCEVKGIAWDISGGSIWYHTLQFYSGLKVCAWTAIIFNLSKSKLHFLITSSLRSTQITHFRVTSTQKFSYPPSIDTPCLSPSSLPRSQAL